MIREVAAKIREVVVPAAVVLVAVPESSVIQTVTNRKAVIPAKIRVLQKVALGQSLEARQQSNRHFA